MKSVKCKVTITFLSRITLYALLVPSYIVFVAIFSFCQSATAYLPEGKEPYISLSSTYVVVGRSSELGPVQDNPIILSAEYIEYTREGNKVLARGNVKIEDRDVIVECDEAIFDLEEEKIEAKGEIILQDKETIIHGSQIIYDLRTGGGVIDNASSFIEPWYVSGAKIERVSDKEIVVHNGYITSCELSPPHYRLKAKKIRVLLGDRFYAYNVLTYLGKIPIFYFPFYWRSLRERRFKWGLKLGSNREEGFFAKGNFGYAFSSKTYGSLLLDYMTKKGVGFGGRYDYNLQDKVKGFLYGYYIKEKDTEEKRWRGEAEHFQRLGNDFYFQTKLDYMSNQQFNRVYNKEDWIPMKEELKSHIALTRSRPNYTLRIVGERKDVWDYQTGRFVNILGYSPRLSFATNLLQIKKGLLYYKLGANYANCYLKPYDYVTREFQEGHRLNQSEVYFDLVNKLRLSRRASINTEVGFQESWRDKDEDWNRKNVYKNIYHTQTNLRTRITRSFDTDLTHSFQQEQGKKTTLNKLSILGRIRLLWLLEFTSSTGYSFIGERNLRFDNLLSRVDFTPSSLARFYLEHNYDLNRERTANFQTEAIFGPGARKWSINARLTYLEGTSDYPHHLDILNGFIFPIAQKWRARLTTRYDIYNGELMERGIHLYRDLHCWEARFSWTKIPSKEEIWFTVNLKVFPEERIGLYHNIDEEEWRLRRK
ncbi:MAG: LPS-assembly protein LptD [bacterium]